ncbi:MULTISPECIES: HDIG domain-containing metalloprotein [unclassified Mucilaginibacter]|uniref:HD family phosphohydrolase n=1 Tax=unclassified Mucilaginibacter TaxID=2617802 RepID=UPI002AC94B7B|nr:MULTISPECIES: HDIG domain-containing metalloprotein [unclassified Mucilaginibacter]MEB0263236.1 HDIG domain-containing protein [Mucilaginibacter sp. 10I4]MEB0280317.1 HDIG domain-containing protein [Mucilaginibacter sp. 10B2]MEB0300262.1 HDIG domain-containing protein [Mucilaginibacter sp. 5C4]WPX25619.1 HDIG domain-containing protein [Mucilaginibacter sp. 5C4]
MAKLSSSRQKALLRKYALNVKFFMMLVCVAIIVYALPKQAKFGYEFEKSRIWNQKDLISPYNFAILKTNAEIEADQKAALATVTPIYQKDDEMSLQQQEGFKSDLEVKWHSAGLNEKLKNTYLQTGYNILKAAYDKGILKLNPRYQTAGKNYPVTILSANVAVDKNTSDLFTRERAIAYSDFEIGKIPALDKPFLLNLVQDRLQINLTFDAKLTARLEKEVTENLSITRGMVQKGDVIIGKGSVINDEAYQKLASYKKAFEDNARTNGNRSLVLLGQFLLVGITITLLMVFLYLFRRDIYDDNRLVSLILLVITAMLAMLSLAIKLELPNFYYIPYCIVPIIIRILFDTRLALNIHLLVVMIAGFFVPNSFEFAFYEITAGMVSIYSIKNLIRREQFLISALIITFTYFVSFLGISLIREGTFTTIDWVDFIPFAVSVLLTLLAYPLIYLFEKVFAITSDITLIELTNTNAQLLRDMAFSAPGTFQHSLQVANLAENAIFAIGGNALLVRAGALYHDIGKMENPLFFIENQSSGFNPHDKLPYEESAQIIIRHVSKGIEMARKANLPEIVIDFIRTHHGNTRVDYFYQSFLKNFPEKFINENIFRYPGPIPFSKEAGVLMLADSVEAASRSLKEPDEESISILVDRIVKYKLDQNQLNDSNITLKDLETIKQIFKRMLMSIYHVRIDY